MQCKIYILEHNPPQTKLFFVPVKRLLNNYFIEIGSKSQRVAGMYIRDLIEDGYLRIRFQFFYPCECSVGNREVHHK